MKRRLELLVAGTLAFWAALAYPAWHYGGLPAIIFSGVAMVLCLVPTATTLALSRRTGPDPTHLLMVVLGGTGIRMAAALGGGMGLFLSVPYFRDTAFWVWVLLFYLFTLALEMGLLMAGRSASGNSPIPHPNAPASAAAESRLAGSRSNGSRSI